ncbi:MAG: aromatic ring-hydroxylating dioxygenase subunit alpha [Bythopirellula sp.]|nr:aromatic ring-hydroxylating dioxygenase subunit alpha [Bythopirellula sp.]
MSHYTQPETYAALRRDVEQATTLTPDAYRSEEFFRIEQERLWSRSWVIAGYATEIPQPGDVLVADVAGQSIIVVRDRSGVLRAFHNVCRHRASRLIETNTNCKVIRCPYHGWGYSLEGELLGTPYFQGLDVPAGSEAIYQMTSGVAASFCKEEHPLFPVHLAQWGGLIFLNLAAEPHPFDEWIGDLGQRFCRHPLDELKLVRSRKYEIKANWKLIAENFMEYYHLPWGHPELCNVSGFDNHYRYQGPGMYTGMCTIPLTNDPNTISFDLPTMPGLNPTEAQSAYFVLLFPNIALWMFPHHLVTLLYRPLSAGVTLESMDILVHPSAEATSQFDEVIDRITSFWAFVNEQDVRLVENVQRGLQSRAYPGGRLCYHFEEPVHRFQNMVADLMVGELHVPAGDGKNQAPDLSPMHD